MLWFNTRTKVDKTKKIGQDSEANALLDATWVFKADSWGNNFPQEKNKTCMCTFKWNLSEHLLCKQVI